MLPHDPEAPLCFGRIEIRPAERVVLLDGTPLPLGARTYDVLLALAERRERLVSREELLEVVWPGVIVEDHNITAQISMLRKALGVGVIATVPGRGYRFVAPPKSGGASAEPVRHATAPPPARLPSPRTRFIGQEVPLGDVTRLLQQARLVTLTGIGGSGKTRLALECASRTLDDYPDGARFVDLAPLTSPDRVAFACASALGVGNDAEAALIQRLGAHLAGRRMLIILDNCEHVRTAVAALVDGLLAYPGETRLLATSREPLGVAGEQIYPLQPLALPATNRLEQVKAADAVRLFVDRARLVAPAFDVDADNAATVGEVCRRLDGVALAIELAAARVPLLSVADIASRLNDRFRLLSHGNAAVPRQQALAATMQWSYDLLVPSEQRMFECLATFVGGHTLEAATAVAGSADDYEALELLTALHDKSLLTIDARPDERGHVRYGMLETVRAYAGERLEERNDAAAVRARHAAYFLALAEAAAPHMEGPEQSRWMERLGAEHGNVAAAMAFCLASDNDVDPTWALRLAAGSSEYWLYNEIEHGCRLMERALERAGSGGDPAVRFRAVRGLARMFMHRGQGAAGLPYAQQAITLARSLGNPAWEAAALNAAGTCLTSTGLDAEGMRYYEEARLLAQSSGRALVLAAILNNVANVRFRQGELDAAEQGFRHALHLMRGEGNVRSALIFLHNLVRVCVAAGKPAEARASALEAASLLQGVAEDVLKLELVEVSAGIASIRGEHERAARWWGYTCQRYVDKGYRRPALDEEQLERLMSSTRTAMGEEAYVRAERTGQELDLATTMQEVEGWLAIPPARVGG